MFFFRGSNCHLHFCLLFIMRVNSLRKEFALWKQILSFKSRLHFGRVESTRDANRKSQKLSPFERMAEKKDVP